jgi:hypothetical protein
VGYNLMVRKLRYLGGAIEGNSIRIFNLASRQTSAFENSEAKGSDT